MICYALNKTTINSAQIEELGTRKNVRVMRNFELGDVFLNGETMGKSGRVVRVML